MPKYTLENIKTEVWDTIHNAIYCGNYDICYFNIDHLIINNILINNI